MPVGSTMNTSNLKQVLSLVRFVTDKLTMKQVVLVYMVSAAGGNLTWPMGQ